jgi:hypothetical protein
MKNPDKISSTSFQLIFSAKQYVNVRFNPLLKAGRSVRRVRPLVRQDATKLIEYTIINREKGKSEAATKSS